MTLASLTAADFDEAMDFLNLVFSMSSRPHDFARLLPILYRPTDEHMGCNRVIRENGRIRALVGVFPMAWNVGAATLRVAGIGGVAVHPAERGRGHMKALMTAAVGQIRSDGYALSWLGGQRQRYQNFGYELAGTGLQATLSRRNLQAFPAPGPVFTFERLAAGDTATVRAAQGFHARTAAHTVRTESDFALRCVSWHHEPWVARAGDGRFAGYLVANAEGRFVTEVGATDADTRFELLCAWVQARDHVTVELSPFDPGLVSRCAALADGIAVRPSGNWLITNWPATVTALLQARAAAAPMPEGSLVLEIAGAGRLAIELQGGIATCEATQAPADLAVSALAAIRLLFGPLRPGLVVLPLPARAVLLEAWCPLPLAWATQDGV